MHQYNNAFYEYIDRGAASSACKILPLLQEHLSINSVVDFGCGRGCWLAAWKKLNVMDVVGLDGGYVSQDMLRISPSEFVAVDLGKSVSLHRHFDLVQSLEVAEHIPESSADIFVDSLVAHGNYILFSAATVGQGGENHINEQPYSYWREKFLQRGYVLVDCIRPRIAGDRAIMPWYRYNIFLFIARDVFGKLPAQFRISVLHESEDVPDLSPVVYRLRKRLVGILPVKARTALSTIKKYLYVAITRLKSSR